MKRPLVTLIAALAALLISGGILHAITNGRPDGDAHPYVGVLVFDDANGPAWSCSGALISDTVVLTAGHCTYGAVAARVWFASDIRTVGDWPDGGTVAIEGTPYAHPDYGTRFIDIGVVVLDEPVTGVGTAELPSEGIVDTLPMKADIDLVGYGVQWKQQQAGPPRGRWAWNGLRYFARTQYVGSEEKLGVHFLKLTANPGGGKGGVCFGDSGGPDLLGHTVVGVNSFVTNYNCTGVTYSMRVDRADVLDWLSGYVQQ